MSNLTRWQPVREIVTLSRLPRPRRRADPGVVAERARLLSLLAPEVSP